MKRAEDERKKKGKHISREKKKEKCDKRKTIWRQYEDDIGDLGVPSAVAVRKGLNQ